MDLQVEEGFKPQVEARSRTQGTAARHSHKAQPQGTATNLMTPAADKDTTDWFKIRGDTLTIAHVNWQWAREGGGASQDKDKRPHM
jgi:hypothetical protein